jgi:hypothetical protein
MLVDWRRSEAAQGVARKLAWLNPDRLIPDLGFLRTLIVGTGVGWSVLFVALGLGYELQLYGDGSIFSYAIATEATWPFHWHNISSRIFVHLLTHIPAETYVRLSGDAGGGIAIYGLLFFGAPFLGLAATYAADRSGSRVVFTCACLSTACLCPLVFGCPTEMWVAHSAFWPAVAISHCARRDALGAAAVFVSMLALALTHEGALVLAASILAPLLLRGTASFAFRRAAVAFLAAVAVWAAVRVLLPPDAYFASIVATAAFNFFDVTALAQSPMLVLVGAVAAYLALAASGRSIAPCRSRVLAVPIVVAGLAVYWVWFDNSIHAENRYQFRTALFIATPLLGMVAAVLSQSAPDGYGPCPSRLAYLQALIKKYAPSRAAAGAIIIIALVHAVETAKYVSSWTDYKAAVRALATGSLSDPQLGDSSFVSADRMSRDRQALSWFSTTPYLSVLVAPRFQPSRLVVDPNAGYYWLSCETAAANHQGNGSIPRASRRLVRIYSCLHRPPSG